MAGPTRFSIVNFASREQVLTGDLVRVQKLASRDAQNALRSTSRSLDGSTAAGNLGDVGTIGAPVNAASLLATIAPVGATFQMTVGAGECYFDDPAVTGADDSPMQVVRWAQQNATHATPHGTFNRIDLIVAEPFTVETDATSRNILVDPVLRTIQAQTVNKSSNPVATLTVVTGTAAASPLPPAVPAGALAIFEVFVPAAAADATSFRAVRRVHRRVEFPFPAMHGIVAGCSLYCDDVDEDTTSATTRIIESHNNKVVIDGEVIQFGKRTGFGMAAGVDTLANPFSPAAGTNDKPYYLYLVGGRSRPEMEPPGGGQALPVTLWASLTAPDDFGRPSAAISTGRGSTTAGAVFVGIGFVVAGSTRNKPLRYVGDYAHAMRGYVEEAAFTPIAGLQDYTLTSKPASSTSAIIGIRTTGTIGPFNWGIIPKSVDVPSSQFFIANAHSESAATHKQSVGELALPSSGPHLRLNCQTLGTTPTCNIAPLAYRMGVLRLM